MGITTLSDYNNIAKFAVNKLVSFGNKSPPAFLIIHTNRLEKERVSVTLEVSDTSHNIVNVLKTKFFIDKVRLITTINLDTRQIEWNNAGSLKHLVSEAKSE